MNEFLPNRVHLDMAELEPSGVIRLPADSARALVLRAAYDNDVSACLELPGQFNFTEIRVRSYVVDSGALGEPLAVFTVVPAASGSHHWPA